MGSYPKYETSAELRRPSRTSSLSAEFWQLDPPNQKIQFSRTHNLQNLTDDEDDEIEQIEYQEYQRKSNNNRKPFVLQNLLFGRRDTFCRAFAQDIKNEINYLTSPLSAELMAYTTENVKRTAFVSRLLLLCVQIIATLTLPPHVNDGFKTPKYVDGFFDRIVDSTFGGFVNWDGQYFLHIAAHGYTHENTMAFFPLFPLIVGILANIFHLILFPVFSVQSIALLIGWVFNTWCFQHAAVALSEIVKFHIRNAAAAEHLIPTVVILFCYNPASVFFSAFYSESIFAFLTFTCVLSLYQRNFDKAILFASASAICRSNGLLNFGLIAAAFVGCLTSRNVTLNQRYTNCKSCMMPLRQYSDTVINIIKTGVYCLIGLIPFALFQMYCVRRFCDNIVLPNEKTSDFCRYNGLPYTYIQSANWNVGFFRYFELKQIPNFMLAMPVLITLAYQAQRHAKILKIELFQLKKPSYENLIEMGLAGHGLFISIFCLFFVHVQVSTRMIMSACPYLYIYITKSLHDEKSLFLQRRIQWMPHSFFICTWFSLYFLVGTVGFSLGYPWT